jgi:hypothetical protein
MTDALATPPAETSDDGWPEVLTAIPANARDYQPRAEPPDVPDGLYDGLPVGPDNDHQETQWT